MPRKIDPAEIEIQKKDERRSMPPLLGERKSVLNGEKKPNGQTDKRQMVEFRAASIFVVLNFVRDSGDRSCSTGVYRTVVYERTLVLRRRGYNIVSSGVVSGGYVPALKV